MSVNVSMNMTMGMGMSMGPTMSYGIEAGAGPLQCWNTAHNVASGIHHLPGVAAAAAAAAAASVNPNNTGYTIPPPAQALLSPIQVFRKDLILKQKDQTILNLSNKTGFIQFEYLSDIVHAVIGDQLLFVERLAADDDRSDRPLRAEGAERIVAESVQQRQPQELHQIQTDQSTTTTASKQLFDLCDVGGSLSGQQQQSGCGGQKEIDRLV